MSSTQLNQTEKAAKNIDDAILAALEELNASRDMVDIEILDEGSKGILGIFGGKDARVRVTLKSVDSKTTDAQTADPKAAAETFLNKVFADMGIDVKLEMTFNSNELSVNLIGEDMGIIIGKRGETLDALQYLTSLVVNRGEGAYVKVTLDTENYREKRYEALKNLAIRIADKVEKTNRRHIFEPMTPYERRVIHAALQSHETVSTYSIGEDPNRKVVVALKSDIRKR